jgi:hypothetical protein
VKKIYLLMILVVATGTIEAQKTMHKIFGSESKIITGSCKVWVYEIDPIPVMSLDQVQGENYIYDYRVLKSMTYRKKDASGLIIGVMDTTQYLYGVNKKCPFMGKYAIQFRKGNRALTIMVSSEPCDKAIIFCPGSIIDKKHIDLKDKGSIVDALRILLNPIAEVEQKK